MRLLFFLLSAMLAIKSSAQNVNVTHRSTLTYTNEKLSNVWGYASGGNEYALVGAFGGMSVVDVTNPDVPVEIVQIPSPVPGSPQNAWREIKTYQNYAYIVSEAGGGVQIVDLSDLPGSNLTYYSYNGNGAINGQLTKAHALHVDVTKGYLYVYGSNLFSGRALVFNLNGDPYNPNYVGYFNSNFSGSGNYVHDGFVDNDIMYSGHIYSGFFSIVNMANKSNPVLVTTQTTPNLFTHNTWRSGNTLFTTDEKPNSFLAAYDITNTGNITLLDKIQSNPGSNSIVHNTYIIDDYAVTSWYTDGITIVDASRPANLVQVGNYDTYGGAGNGFNGCWGVYPYLPSGNILASNITAQGTSNGELWVLTPTYIRGCYLEGQITNASNGQALGGALVKILASNTQETSAANGNYKLGQLENGTFTVQVSKSGFVTYNTSVSLSNGVLTTLNVALQPVGLPVELLRFSARAEGRDALLEWETATERDNSGFEVQHNVSAGEWGVAGFVPGKGDSETPVQYEFRVPDLPPGSHFFRLRQMDEDGKSTLTDAKALEIKGKTFHAAFRPNVLSGMGELYFFTENPTPVRVEIFNAAGSFAGLRWDFDLEREAALPVDAGHLPDGLYFAAVTTEGERLVIQFLKK